MLFFHHVSFPTLVQAEKFVLRLPLSGGNACVLRLKPSSQPSFFPATVEVVSKDGRLVSSYKTSGDRLTEVVPLKQSNNRWLIYMQFSSNHNYSEVISVSSNSVNRVWREFAQGNISLDLSGKIPTILVDVRENWGTRKERYLIYSNKITLKH